MTADNITVETRNGNREVSIGDIRNIRLDGEPSWLSSAKTRFNESRYETCYESLTGSQLEDPVEYIAQEVEYYKSMAAANIALAGGQVSSKEAGTLLLKFVQQYPSAYGHYRAVEKFADLAADTGAFNKANEYYEKLLASSSTEIQSRATVKLGRSKLYGGESAEAERLFSGIVDGEVSNEMKLEATCFLVQAMAFNNKADEGIKMIEELIDRENSDQTTIFARAYIALGCCHMQKQDWKAARIAFMHTQLLYQTERDAYTEALYRLNKVAQQLQDTERSARTRQLLKSRFPNSYWTSTL